MIIPKEVIEIGYQNKEIKEALRAAEVAKNQKHPKTRILQELQQVYGNPEAHLEHAIYKHLAALMHQKRDSADLIKPPVAYDIWGRQHIESTALDQMRNVKSLAPTVGRSPDARCPPGLWHAHRRGGWPCRNAIRPGSMIWL